jgi:hypothetical protein
MHPQPAATIHVYNVVRSLDHYARVVTPYGIWHFSDLPERAIAQAKTALKSSEIVWAPGLAPRTRGSCGLMA